MPSGDLHKLSIDITDEQFTRMQRLFPHGIRRMVFSILIDDLCDLIEENGEVVLGAILQRHIGLRDVGIVKDSLNAKDRNA